jgi:hypothetical protein
MARSEAPWSLTMKQDQITRKFLVAAASAAIGFFLLASSSTATNARGGGFGFGGRTGHFHGLFGRGSGLGFAAVHRHGFFDRRWRNPWWFGNGAWSQYGAFVPYAPYWPYEASNTTGSAPPVFVFVQPQPPAAIACSRSQEVVTVPSEDGGTRPITVTRCY